ncbi:hypothetical protein K458DRAFT_91099 [Lentithecium fluviatile CBS 122367]|uniref:Uncharacterized protein n=1 Tax=Lentithecium fluviatile CBS 122367 TaxID=1168545 RepID=A0A6G1IS52_9PLEO|nr:hypothetical protein K458DRAFT_91099 [Lentithecium fluviatile CBS 122367]
MSRHFQTPYSIPLGPANIFVSHSTTVLLSYHPPNPPLRARSHPYTTTQLPRTPSTSPTQSAGPSAQCSTISIRNTQHLSPQTPTNQRLRHSCTVTPGAVYHTHHTTTSVPRPVLSGFNGFRASGSEVTGSYGDCTCGLDGLGRRGALCAVTLLMGRLRSEGTGGAGVGMWIKD